MRSIIIVAALLTCPASAAAQIPSAQIPEPVIVGGRMGAAYTPIIEALRKGGLVLLFRHDRTDVTGLWDYEPYREGACDGERNLSEAGRTSARAVGNAIRMLRIPVRRVISSTYCRAADSATLMFGGVHAKTADLLGADGKTRNIGDVRRDLRAIIEHETSPKGVLVLVGHHGTTDAATTRMLDEGDALVLRPVPGADPQIMAHIPAARWEEIARDLDRQAFEPRRSD